MIFYFLLKFVYAYLALPVIVNLVVKLITTLQPWCSGELFALAEELIRHGWESVDFEVPLCILQAILCSVHAEDPATEYSKCENDRVCGSGCTLDDSSLVCLLELVVRRHSCAELVRTACKLLEKRVTKSGISLKLSSSKCGQVETSNPFRSLDPRTAMLACMETPGKSRDIPTNQKLPLVISEDCARRLLELCIETADLHTVLLLCSCSRKIAKHFEESHLQKVCRQARKGKQGALGIVEGCLKLGPSDEGVDVISSLLLKHCARMVLSEDSGAPQVWLN